MYHIKTSSNKGTMVFWIAIIRSYLFFWFLEVFNLLELPEIPLFNYTNGMYTLQFSPPDFYFCQNPFFLCRLLLSSLYLIITLLNVICISVCDTYQYSSVYKSSGVSGVVCQFLTYRI